MAPMSRKMNLIFIFDTSITASHIFLAPGIQPPGPDVGAGPFLPADLLPARHDADMAGLFCLKGAAVAPPLP